MRPSIVLMLIAAGAVAILSGCSGAGTPATDLQGGTVQTLAQATLTSVALVDDWLKMLYERPHTQVPVNTEYLTVGGVRMLHETWRLPDGGEGEFLGNPEDGSFTETVTWGNEVLRASAGPIEPDGNIRTWSGEVLYPHGQRRTWHQRLDLTPGHVFSIGTNGQVFTADGQIMSYRLVHKQAARDVLVLTMQDGTVLTWQCPLRDGDTPSFSEGLRGSLKVTNQSELRFALSSEGERWNTWTIEDDAGRAGTFVLDENMAGSGPLEIDGSIQGQLQWTEMFEGAVDLLGAGQTPVWPSAAARNFQMSTWIRSSARLGPHAMF